jgi:hypothetical protein
MVGTSEHPQAADRQTASDGPAVAVASGQTGRRILVRAVLLSGLLMCLVLLAFAAPLRSELRFTVFPQDEGLLLVYPSEMLHGAVPDRSFQSVYGPTGLWTIAAAFKLAGYSVAAERSVGIIYRLVILGSVVLLAWRRRGAVASLAAAAMCVVLFTGTLGLAAFAWLAALALGALALLLLDVGLSRARRPAPIAAAGLVLGLAVGARLDFVLPVLLVVLALLLTRRQSYRWLLPGIALGLVPLVVNVVQAGVPAIVRNQLIEPILVSGPGRRVPLSTLSDPQLWLLGICVLVAMASLSVGLYRLRLDSTSWEGPAMLTVGAFEVGLLPQAFQRTDSLHLALVGCFVLPAATLLPGWAPRVLPRWTQSAVPPVATAVLILALAAPSYGQIYRVAATSVLSPNPVTTVHNDGRSVPVQPTDLPDLKLLLDRVDSLAKPGQRIFVGPLDLRTANYTDTYIYFLLPRLSPGSFYLEMDPGVANAKNSRLASDIRSDQFLILTSEYSPMVDPDPSTRFGPDKPNVLVRTDFDQLGQWGPWHLFERSA